MLSRVEVAHLALFGRPLHDALACGRDCAGCPRAQGPCLPPATAAGARPR